MFTNGICKGEKGSKVCQYMKDQIKVNDDWIKDTVQEKAENDPFWHMVNLFYQQMEGITEGWINKTLKQEAELPPDFDLVSGIKLINYIADMFDYMEKYNLEAKEVIANNVTRPTCSALIKHLPDQADLYVSHNTWHEYRAMGYRFLKKYQLNYHVLPGSKEIVPGHTATMSSYAGTILSLDDFVTLSSGLVSTETSLFVYNSSLFGASDPREQVFEPARVMAANRLATTGKEFTDMVSLYNSGTYNNQWMVVDNKLFTPGQTTLSKGLFWVLEQIPNFIHKEDLTSVLSKKTFWPSYNSPYFQDVFNKSGNYDLMLKLGDWFSYDRTPRALIFARDVPQVSDIPSMIKLMRYNDYTKDPLSACNCTPAYSAENAISARCDLNPRNGTYPFGALGHRSHGGTDMKLTTSALASKLQFIAQSGPTWDPLPPYRWSEQDFLDTPHVGHPDLWQFAPVIPMWNNLTAY
eukprot:GFUD01132792.1.p1 GENE.GFUD01132792.1~~GFUD01132792.1.p1  ORF type:complete len:465 (+),score=101.42 GFUD01132792.1:343-1737(+)